MGQKHERLVSLDAQTETVLNIDAGLDSHPNSLGNWGETLVDGAGGHGETIYATGRNILKSVHEELSGMHAAVKANQVATRVIQPRPGHIASEADFDISIPADRRAAVADALNRSFARFASKADKGLAQVQDSINSIGKEMEVALRHPSAARADVVQESGEIRSYIKSLPVEKRASFVLQAIKTDKDHAVASAVLNVSPFASGITRSDFAALKREAMQVFTPRLFAQHEAALGVLTHLDRVTHQVVDTVAKLTPTVKRDAGAEAAARLAAGQTAINNLKAGRVS